MAKKKAGKKKTTRKPTHQYGTPEWQRYQDRKAEERRKRGFIGNSSDRGSRGGTALGSGSAFSQMRGASVGKKAKVTRAVEKKKGKKAGKRR